MLTIAVVILSILVLFLLIYLIFFQQQLRSINRQLEKRLSEHTRQPICLELMNRELNGLAANINKYLKAEEILRLTDIREEKKFKELIANISHDLRTPLTAIKGYQQLLEKGELSDEQRRKLQIAQKHADELGNLIEHFFEYSYLINAEPTVHAEKMNLTNLVTECLAAMVPTLEENNLAVRFKEAPPVFVLADKELTTRILQNLIRNCIQYSTGDIEVKMLTAPQTNQAVLFVRNPVKSDSELEAEKLFDRFYTGDKARSKSTGLGLSIVRLLAEQMGGSVGAAMDDGKLGIQVKLPIYKNDQT